MPERVVGCGTRPGPAVDDDKSSETFGVGRREDEAHRCPAERRDQRRAVTAGRIHDRADVVDPGVDRGQRLQRDRIGHADAAFVEGDQTPDTGQAVTDVGDRSDLPLGLLVAHPLVREDEVDRAFADRLEGDVQVADPRVLRLGCHGTSICGRAEQIDPVRASPIPGA